MGNELSTVEDDKELKDMKEQLEQLAEAEKAKAEETPHPEPIEVKAPEVPEVQPTPVASPEVKPEGKKDPMEWAKEKGFKTPEDMARALLQKEQEFHQSRQKAERETPPIPQATWQPTPQMPPMGYPPPAPSYYPQPPAYRGDFRDVAALYPNVDPEDVKRVMPMILDVAKVISAQDKAELERKYGHIERATQRNNELMTLMQDPAFRDNRVQKEIHAVLDSDPSIFQREPARALTIAYEKALGNMARRQLQTGMSEETTPDNRPPVTAGGGNGSANTVPIKVNAKMFDSWNEKEQEAFIKSNGRVIPKR